MLFTSLSEETKLTKFSKEVSRLRTENLKKEISQILDASDSVFNNTSIWVLSMTLSLVFSAWTSTLSSRDQEAGLVSEEDAKAESAPNTELVNNRRCNGSRRNMTEPFIIDLYNLIIGNEYKS